MNDYTGQTKTLPAPLASLIEQPHWVVWKWEATKTGKPTKVPYQARNPQIKAASDNPATWATSAEAIATVGVDGVGFVLTDTDIAAFDIDNCRDPTTSVIYPWALELVEKAQSYTEVTISGTGLRIIGRGTGPAVHRKLPVVDGVSCEFYRKATRYIVMTGDQLGSAELANIDAVIDTTLLELDVERPGSPADGGQHARQDADDDKLDSVIREGEGGRFGGDRSKAVWFVINEMLRRGYRSEAIVAVLLDRANRVSDHIYDQSRPHSYVERQVAEARAEITLDTDEEGSPKKSPNNICIALLKLGVRVRYDQFADRVLIDGLPGFGPALDDPAEVRLLFTFGRRFGLAVPKWLLRDVLHDVARLNGYHPVRDYLDGLKWDGIPRLDRWLVDYGEAEATSYVCAVGAPILIAAVRRVRQPGCKFDEMVVLENPDQGVNKSTALAILAVREEWFSDDLPLNVHGKEVIERTRGRWIIEVAELSGMRTAEIEHVKSFLSRRIDRARMAYGYEPTEAPRQWVPFGTTNHTRWLKDTTGNRRIWPVRVVKIDIETLTRDRDQLWAEAAAREASGESIRLDPELWAAAADEQAARTISDPYFDILHDALGHIQAGKISSATIRSILDVHGAQLGQVHNDRMGQAMRQLGWNRPSKSNLVRIEGKVVVGYVKGEPPWPTVKWGEDGWTAVSPEEVQTTIDVRPRAQPMPRDEPEDPGWNPDR